MWVTVHVTVTFLLLKKKKREMMMMKVGRVMLEERKVDFEMVNFRMRISIPLIPCREIKNSRSRLYIMKESYKIYIENK